MLYLQVRMEMWDNGTLGGSMTFDARGSNKTDWLSAERLIDSSWEDVRNYIENHDSSVSVEGV